MIPLHTRRFSMRFARTGVATTTALILAFTSVARGDGAKCPTPVCADYSYYLLACVLKNPKVFPGTSVFNLDLQFKDGSDKGNVIYADSSPSEPWKSIRNGLAKCPKPFAPPPELAQPVPDGILQSNGHSINIVCTTDATEIARLKCTAGQQACRLYEPQLNAYIGKPYCSAMDNPIKPDAGGGKGPYPPPIDKDNELQNTFYNIYGWTKITFLLVYTVRNPLSCQVGDPRLGYDLTKYGGLDQPCFGNNSCNSKLFCVSGTCQANQCNADAEPYCDDSGLGFYACWPKTQTTGRYWRYTKCSTGQVCREGSCEDYTSAQSANVTASPFTDDAAASDVEVIQQDILSGAYDNTFLPTTACTSSWPTTEPTPAIGVDTTITPEVVVETGALRATSTP